MPLTFAETPLYYKDSQGNYHRVLSGADMTGYRTASAQDVIDAAQDADIASRAKTDEIGIVITGARPAASVTPGQYVIVRGSTITGVTDGLYTAVNALSPSTDVTAADLTVVSGGGLNELNKPAILYCVDNNVTDWNNSVSAGWYAGASASNNPITSTEWISVLCLPANNNPYYPQQIAFTSEGIYRRTKNGQSNPWSNWAKY